LLVWPCALAALVGVLALGGSASASSTGAPAPRPDGTCGFCVLAPTGTSVTDSSGALLSVSGANMVVDSSSAGAVKLTSSGSVTAPSVGVVGTVVRTASGTVQNLTTGISPVPDPLAAVPAPALPLPTPVPSVSVSSGKSATITPGVYDTISVTGSGNLTFQPGTYVIRSGFTSTGTGRVAGAGVTLYLACSTYPTPCKPGTKGATFTLTGTGSSA
jgi:hypothetical protein